MMRQVLPAIKADCDDNRNASTPLEYILDPRSWVGVHHIIILPEPNTIQRYPPFVASADVDKCLATKCTDRQIEHDASEAAFKFSCPAFERSAN